MRARTESAPPRRRRDRAFADLAALLASAITRLMFGNRRRDRRQLAHLMALKRPRRIIVDQGIAAVFAAHRRMIMHRINFFERNQRAHLPGMTRGSSRRFPARLMLFPMLLENVR
jgi:hypothetical protein